MKKVIEIQIPEGYDDAVFDQKTNEIKFVKNDTKPRSWYEYCQQVYHTPSFVAIIESRDECSIDRNRGETPLISEFNTKEEAQAVIALCKLLQLRDAWLGNWKPDWNDSETTKFAIFCKRGVPAKDYSYTFHHILAFPPKKCVMSF